MVSRTKQAAVERNEDLPRCEGPTLHPFRDRSKAIKFLSLLSDPDAEGHGHVFEVQIGEHLYALKMFNFFDPDDYRIGDLDERVNGVAGEGEHVVSDQMLQDHMDPFYAECRAFGKINEENLNSGKTLPVAVKCYGFTSVPASVEKELRDRFQVYTWGRPMSEEALPVDDRQPFRAIVKELIREDTKFTQRTIKKMATALKRLNNAEVYPMDIRAENYKNGLLVDFSVALTEPHILFKIRPHETNEITKKEDAARFNRMLKEKNILNWTGLGSGKEYRKKLRSSSAQAGT